VAIDWSSFVLGGAATLAGQILFVWLLSLSINWLLVTKDWRFRRLR
jgi:hypothetical protein